jgi:hypothetical protein
LARPRKQARSTITKRSAGTKSDAIWNFYAPEGKIFSSNHDLHSHTWTDAPISSDTKKYSSFVLLNT